MSSRQRKARLVLLWLALGYLGIQLGLLAAEEWWPFLRDPHYGYRVARLRERLAHADNRPVSVIMLGSSRTEGAFRAAPVEQELERQMGRPVALFNFGIPSAGPSMELLVLDRLLKQGIRPDGLLVEVLPPFLAGSLWESSLSHLSTQRLNWRDLRLVQGLDLRHENRRLDWCCESLLWPCYAHRYAIVSHLAPILLPVEKRIDFSRGIDLCGWVEGCRFPVDAEIRRKQTEKAQQNFSAYWNDDQPCGPNCTAMRLLLQRCRQEGIAVKLVLLPEGPTFRSWYRPAGWQALEGFLEQLHQEFGVEVVNAREWIDEEGFFDSHHLLPEAAARFSDRLGREVLLPWLRAGMK
jgi:hypothetical protein